MELPSRGKTALQWPKVSGLSCRHVVLKRQFPKNAPRTVPWSHGPNWTALVIAAATVAIALAAMVGCAFTSWHYWHAEKRAQGRSAEERYLAIWEQQHQQSRQRRQEQAQVVAAIEGVRSLTKARTSSFPGPVGTSALSCP